VKSRRTRLILVAGGAASGKSVKALKLAGRSAPRGFIATGQPLDEEMAARIRRHQASRGSGWETAEVPIDVAKWVRENQGRYRTLVLDCLTLWVSNLSASGVPESEVLRLVDELLDAVRCMRGRVVMVTNELGMGIVPVDPATRQFRNLAGQVNQLIAQEADEVHLVICGLSVRLK
jgi:adenosylcobinamide kinase/adenosylcobinamide-phosphate guanylyltransferase